MSKQIVGVGGNVLKSDKKKAEEELIRNQNVIECDILTDNSEVYNKESTVKIIGPGGKPMIVPVMYALQNLITGLYGVMNSLKTKEFLLKLTDGSNELETEKSIKIKIGKINKPKNDSDKKDEVSVGESA